MKYAFLQLLGVALIMGAATVSASLSDNLVVNGDFESTANLKNDTSPDGVPPHRFSQQYDFGKWIGHWGPATNPGGLGGFSTFDNPRDGSEVGGTTLADGLGNVNRSVDPTDPGNHVFETIMFYPRYAQWIEAPANQTPGPVHFSFDWINEAYPGTGTNPHSWGRLFVYGMNVPPIQTANVFDATSAGAPNPVAPDDPGTAGFDPVAGDGELLFQIHYGEYMHGAQVGEYPAFDYLGNWHTVSTDLYGGEVQNPDNPEDTYPVYAGTGDPYYAMWGVHKFSLELEQVYPYYVIVNQPFVYAEDDPNFWLYGGRVTDAFVMAFDNFDLRVSVADAAGLPGDFDGSGVVDTQDINPFILALTNPAGFELTYGVDPAVYDTNNDGVINTEDINPFIIILTGGGQAAIIPEPATSLLLAVGLAGVARRR